MARLKMLSYGEDDQGISASFILHLSLKLRLQYILQVDANDRDK